MKRQPISVPYTCSACGCKISLANHLISLKKHKLSLCLEHQVAVTVSGATVYAKKLFLALKVHQLDVVLEYNDKGKKKVDIAIPGKLYIEVEGIHHRQPKIAFTDLQRTLYSLQDAIPTICIPNELVYDPNYFPLAVKSIVQMLRN